MQHALRGHTSLPFRLTDQLAQTLVYQPTMMVETGGIGVCLRTCRVYQLVELLDEETILKKVSHVVDLKFMTAGKEKVSELKVGEWVGVLYINIVADPKVTISLTEAVDELVAFFYCTLFSSTDGPF